MNYYSHTIQAWDDIIAENDKRANEALERNDAKNAAFWLLQGAEAKRFRDELAGKEMS
jgi:hypothetical protein